MAPDVTTMAVAELVNRVVLTRRWIAAGLGVVAILGVVVGVALLVTRDREAKTAGTELEDSAAIPGLPNGAELVDIDGDGEMDLLIIGESVTDLRPDSTISTAWIAGISAIVSAFLTGGVSLVVALLGRNDKEALAELGKRIEDHTHPGLVPA